MANGKLVSWITLWFFFGISGSTVIFSGFVGMIIMILKHQVLSNTLVHSLLISENHTRKTQTQHSLYSHKKKREKKVGIPGNT
ncbi:hypothetical protein ES319_A12G063100v1 [Gossypium barbadense]|uniref:Uncharacterized protein n=3 Tax=Gossypium TaxID=3633 RepID=A0A5J5T6U7_GOSBA|nr:hypothetical protein ES319_A12G063100v1 [Gossypium barbadense]TYG89021.1 hypothetical protein ES288_A12G067500v1 [Gossypium darwinii]TYH94867.1 hypothetical protein ES332_A12G067800v1 [Gossypium tomentosum]